MPSIMTTTGEGCAIVHVDYDVDSDGDVTNLDVTYQGVTVNGALSLEQVEEIEAKCLASYLKECKAISAEFSIERYLSSMECES